MIRRYTVAMNMWQFVTECSPGGDGYGHRWPVLCERDGYNVTSFEASVVYSRGMSPAFPYSFIGTPDVLQHLRR